MFEANEHFQVEKAYSLRVCWCQEVLKRNMFEATFFLVEHVRSERVSLNRRCLKRKIDRVGVVWSEWTFSSWTDL